MVSGLQRTHEGQVEELQREAEQRVQQAFEAVRAEMEVLNEQHKGHIAALASAGDEAVAELETKIAALVEELLAERAARKEAEVRDEVKRAEEMEALQEAETRCVLESRIMELELELHQAKEAAKEASKAASRGVERGRMEVAEMWTMHLTQVPGAAHGQGQSRSSRSSQASICWS